MVRSKVGGSKFAEVYNSIRQGVLGKGEEDRSNTTTHHKSRSCGETEDPEECVKEGEP